MVATIGSSLFFLAGSLLFPLTFAQDDFALEDGLASGMMAQKNQPRPQVEFPPALKSQGAAILAPTNDPPLTCGSTRRLCGGDEFVIESENLPLPSPANVSCRYRFDVREFVKVDLMCFTFDLPCADGNALTVDTTYTGAQSRLCSKSSGPLVNQRVRLRHYGIDHTLFLEHVTSSAAAASGAGFRCLVRGFSGVTPPYPLPDVLELNPPPSPPIQELAECGTTVKGASQYPWNVAIFNRQSFCSGSLIDQRWILTASHCVEAAFANNTKVYLGCDPLTGNCETAALDVDLVVPHRSYFRSLNDLGMLRLALNVTFSDNIRPICLPERLVDQDSNTTMTVTEWDKSSASSTSLIVASLVTTSDEVCDAAYNSHFVDFPVLCGVEEMAGVGAICSGDAGSFLGARRNVVGPWEQNGIVAFGHVRETCSSQPMGFTEVKYYMAHIDRIRDFYD